MPLSFVLILSRLSADNYTLMFSRYYEAGLRCNIKRQSAFEAEIAASAEGYLSRNLDGLHCMTAGKNDIRVTFQRLGQLVVFVGGTDEMDEIALADVVACVRGLILALVGLRGGEGDSDKDQKSGLGESDLLNPSVYGNFSLAVDELVAGDGHLDSTDIESLLLRSKLKV